MLADMEIPLSTVNLTQFSLSPNSVTLTSQASNINNINIIGQQSFSQGVQPPSSPMSPGFFASLETSCLFSAPTGTGANAAVTGSSLSDYTALGGQDLPDTKEGIEELCPVCGDRVSGYHYGLLTCESCKGFFKRTVQNKKVYTCVADRSCQIDKAQRKRCPFCRFQKCLDVGMKLEAVRADRMRGGRNKFGPMYKRDRARKLQLLRQRQLACQQTSPSSRTPQAIASNGAEGSSLASLTFASPATSSGHLYTKQQDIQIPQLSSSTSSPDSSPSPLATVPHHHLNSASGPSLVNTDMRLWSETDNSKSFQYEVVNGGSQTGLVKIPPLIRELTVSLDDKEWQNSLYGLLQNQTYNQCEVDLFELLCKVLDQNLFAQVDWARNSVYFKDLKVDDQMKLLQHAWSDMLILDHIHQRLHNNLPDETSLPNGQKFDLLALALLGTPSLADQFNELSARLQELKFDIADYICLKFLLLLNPDVRGLVNRKHVVDAYDIVRQALMDYCVNCYPHIPDKYHKLVNIISELHILSSRGEDFLYHKHISGNAPTQTLLMEMLHAKKK